ncbi:MAG: methyltransferase domain-containing protein [Patescibacteria group bacterium]|nr:methyltransferase domain-containing protein [Patescibacteria group bacterium]MDE1988156.1 methyltransferase domain-containing protein [Patescibacteria group bacterium]MDE2217976.1 methyltransferase domain-containing protein [Patescibacteria group bacterium]
MFSDPAKNIEQFGLSKGMFVADFGAGSGFYAMSAAKAVGDKGRIYAIDVQKDLLQRIKNQANTERMPNIEIIWGDVEKIGGTKLKDDSIDAVIIANILFQAAEKNNICLEATRILKRGGRALVVDWRDSFGGLGPKQSDVFSSSVAKEIFQKNNFALEREFNAGEHHYGLIFKKQ